MNSYDYVIIGNSAAGIGCVEGIRKVDETGSIAIVSYEDIHAYSRCMVTHYISGHIDEKKMYFRKENFYEEWNVTPYLGRRAKRINRSTKVVRLDNGEELGYHKLLLATGASPAPYDVAGNTLEGVYFLRTADDSRAIMHDVKKGGKAIILGGGLVGMKAADALNEQGMDVTIAIASSQLLSQTMDRYGAELIRNAVESNGIHVLTDSPVKEILGDEHVSGIEFENGTIIPADLVILAKGVRPNTILAKTCGLAIDYGILVDEFMKTSDDNIYAAGDVAEALDLIRGGKVVHAIWPNALEQGRVAGMNMAGANVTYGGGIGMNSAEFFGVAAISMGLCRTRDEKGMEVLVCKNGEKGTYRKIVLQNNIIVGAVCIGDVECAGVFNGLILRRTDVSKIKDILLRDDFDYAKLVGAGLVE